MESKVCSMELDLKHPTTTSEPVTAPGDVLEVRCTIDLDTYMDPMSCNCFLCMSKLSWLGSSSSYRLGDVALSWLYSHMLLVSNLMPKVTFFILQIGPKVQALRDEYVRYAVEKCLSVLREYRSALETIAGAVEFLESHVI